MNHRSCLVAKMSHYIDLSPGDLALIESMERKERAYEKGEVLRHRGDPASELFVIRKGWVALSGLVDGGGRQVYDLHFPGDLIGTRDVVFTQAAMTITAVSDVVVCPFPKSALDDVFVQSPRISALLFAFGVLETTTLFDRLMSVARMDASKRLGMFLLQVRSRLGITNPDIGSQFDLPLTQEFIGDMLGLSQVHVNRTWKDLENRGLVKRRAGALIDVDHEQLKAMTEFVDRWYRIDTSWFPGNVRRQ